MTGAVRQIFKKIKGYNATETQSAYTQVLHRPVLIIFPVPLLMCWVGTKNHAQF